jgi:hypothetical protein
MRARLLVVAATGSTQLFADDFESGTLDAWQDGINPSLHRVVRASNAQSGSHYLAVSFPASWNGGTKLVAFYGSSLQCCWLKTETDPNRTFRRSRSRGSWSGLSFRDTPALRLNAVQLTFSVTGGVPHPQELHVDNLVVRNSRS